MPSQEVPWNRLCCIAGRVSALGVSDNGAQRRAHFAVGITNSAPLAIDSGQRCMIDFCLV
jgi:hypothetical protein